LPEETRAFVAAELEKGEPVRLAEAEEIQLRIVQTVRQLEMHGRVTIVRGGPDPWV